MPIQIFDKVFLHQISIHICYIRICVSTSITARKRRITKITYIHTLNTLPSAKSICMLIYSTIAMALKLFSDFRESFFNKLFQFSASSD